METKHHQSPEEMNQFFKKMIGLIPPPSFFENKHQDTDDESEHSDSMMEVDGPSTSTETYTKIKKRKKQKKKADSKPSKQFQNSLVKIKSEQQICQKRLEELKGKKGILSSEEWLEQKRLNRKVRKLRKKIGQHPQRVSGKPHTQINSNSDSKTISTIVENDNSRPIFNKQGQIVYSKFDFTDSGESSSKSKSGLTGKDYKKLLEKIEQRKDKINKVREKDEDLADKLQQKETWQIAIGKAQGEKIKNNPDILKRALKKKEHLKEKRKKVWGQRQETIQKSKKLKQEKRKKNLDSRKQAKIDKKKKKALKKGRVVPGF